jgi:hypothetical protein
MVLLGLEGAPKHHYQSATDHDHARQPTELVSRRVCVGVQHPGQVV